MRKWGWKAKLRYRDSASTHLWHWKEAITQSLHSGEVTSTVLSSDDLLLFSTCKHGCFNLSTVKDGQVLKSVSAKSALSCCDISPNEKRALVGCWDNRVYLYSVETGKELDRVYAHSDGISAIYVMDDRFLTTSWDSTIKLWRYTDRFIVASPLRTFLDCEEALLCLDVSYDGAWAAAGSRNGRVYLFDLRTITFHREVLVSPVRRGDVSSVCFSSDASTFVCMTLENELKQFNLKGEELFSVEVNATGQVRCFESDGEYAVGGTTNGKIYFWKLNEPLGKEVVYEIPRAHEAIICTLVVAYNGSCVISGAIDGTVRTWLLQPAPAKPGKPKRARHRARPGRPLHIPSHLEARHRGYNASSLFSSASPFTTSLEEAQWFLEC
ncbi:hypothetical protein PINS_up007837 [Pythium insidiosum]|nr:hypothetical protein PINS_up007837 [Pythium insidiosum]